MFIGLIVTIVMEELTLWVKLLFLLPTFVCEIVLQCTWNVSVCALRWLHPGEFKKCVMKLLNCPRKQIITSLDVR